MEKNTDIQFSSGRKGIVYRIFKQYVRLAHQVYYGTIYFLNRERLPEDVPLIVVSNHQNSLNDALALILAIHSRGKRKIRAITRSDAFDYPVFRTIFRGLGILPAYRLTYQGMDNMANNEATFVQVRHELLNNGTVVIYPEAGHQDKRWLGQFSFGYLRLAFEAAEQSNYEKEIFVMPSCNHYSNYFNIGEDILVMFGEPFSLKPYYNLYKERHYTALREVNKIIREIISDMMLNIQDLDNYAAIDFLRNTYGIKYAESHGFNPAKLPEKLSSDKLFVKCLETIKASDEGHELQNVYNNAVVVDNKIRQTKIRDDSFDNHPSLSEILVGAGLLLVLFPLYIVAYIFDIIVIIPPKQINRKISDEMLHGTINLIFSVLITIPLSNMFVAVAVWAFTGSILTALASLVCLPFMFMFVTAYEKACNKWKTKLRFYYLLKRGKLDELFSLRTDIHERLNKLLLKYEKIT
jgi:1-acyl-sn-glycerol-3-phosphate acyltransferase